MFFRLSGRTETFTLATCGLVAIAVAISNTNAEARRWCRPTPLLVLTSVSPAGALTLGNSLNIHYRIAPGARLDRVKLRVTNKRGELVYLGANLPGYAGNHQAEWPGGKWNQAPHIGALANPRNGPYVVALLAKTAEGGSISFMISLPTQLVLETDLEHDRPSKDEISSGLSRAMLDLKSPERLRVGLVRKGGKLAVYAFAAPEFSAIMEEDLDNDPTEIEVKSVHVRQVMQSTFPDGAYSVVLTNVLTGAGASLPGQGIVDPWTIHLR